MNSITVANKFSRPSEFRPRERDAAKVLEIVGLERFLKLQESFGGRRVWIPRNRGNWPCGICSIRNRCIRGWHKQGHSSAEIARYLKLSSKTISRIVAHEVPKIAGRLKKAAWSRN